MDAVKPKFYFQSIDSRELYLWMQNPKRSKIDTLKTDLEQKNIKEKFWVILYPRFQYGLETHTLSVENPEEKSIDICFSFESEKRKREKWNHFDLETQEFLYTIEEILRRISIVDGTYHFLKERNPDLNLEDLQKLLLRHFEEDTLDQDSQALILKKEN